MQRGWKWRNSKTDEATRRQNDHGAPPPRRSRSPSPRRLAPPASVACPEGPKEKLPHRRCGCGLVGAGRRILRWQHMRRSCRPVLPTATPGMPQHRHQICRADRQIVCCREAISSRAARSSPHGYAGSCASLGRRSKQAPRGREVKASEAAAVADAAASRNTIAPLLVQRISNQRSWITPARAGSLTPQLAS